MSFIRDLITLEVVTVSGTIDVSVNDVENRDVDDQKPMSVIDFDELFKRIQGEVNSQSKLRIIAATQINIDKDTYNFVSSDLTEAESQLADMHFKSVDLAMKSRAEIVARLKPNFSRKENPGN